MILLPVMVVNILVLSLKDDYSLHSNEINASLAYQRMDSLRNEKKIVIIAGSNGSWSINSRMLEDAFHLPVVNTSCHAGIGVRMQFEVFKKFLREGDILIFCPEYYDGLCRLYGESTLLRIVSTHYPWEYMSFSLRQWLYSYKYIGLYLKEVWEHHETSAASGPYSAEAVNKYGDISISRPHEGTDVAYTFKGTLDPEAIDYYRHVFSYIKEKDVKMIYLPPTLMERNYRDQETQIDSLSAFMTASGIPYMAPTNRYMFPDTLYCNTPYHMTQEGADIRTQRLIEDIRKILTL